MPAIRTRSTSRAAKLIVLLVVVLGSVGVTAASASKPPATPPAPAITSAPPNPTSSTSAAFAFSSNQSGVKFQCSLDFAAFTACTSPRTFAGPLAAGPHAFAVRGTDDRGNPSPTTTYVWTIDHTPPPGPAITGRPADPTEQSSATFSFADSEKYATFACQLDDSAYAPCTSAKTYSGLDATRHTFSVRAFDQAGDASTAAVYSWTVTVPPGEFTLGGDLSNSLHPGLTSPLNVRITNPGKQDLAVAGITVTVRSSTTRSGQPNPACDGTTNLVVSWQYSGPVPLKVPAGRSRTLADLGVPTSAWPQLTMPNLPVNQDACKSTTCSLSYQATATKAKR
jgi:hypothetical protein